MKKIATTTTGSVIVEMTMQEYEAVQQLQAGLLTPSTLAEGREVPPQMNHKEKSFFVAERLKKLGPKKKDSVVRSIESMFQFQGGIDSTEIEKIVVTLQKQKFFAISSDGRVTYAKG